MCAARRRRRVDADDDRRDEVAHRSEHAVAGRRVFELGCEAAYRRWRDAKLAAYPDTLHALTVEVSNLAAPTPAETQATLVACRRSNMCLYRTRGNDSGDPAAARRALAAFARHFGLLRLEARRPTEGDGIIALEAVAAGRGPAYIPYTNRSLGWHTDGYYAYAGPGRMIRSMLLHCIRSAREGGANRLLDHEIAYIRLRDEDPGYIAALAHPEAMTVPANEEADEGVRPENTGPVFVVDPKDGTLAMRYSARKRNIRWRDDEATRSAARALERVLDGDPLVFRATLGPGEGLICNNVLHDRTGFERSAEAQGGRLLFRMRSYDRVGTAGAAADAA